MSVIAALRQRYVTSAVVLVNTLLLFVCLNLAAYAWLQMRSPSLTPPVDTGPLERAYPTLSREEIATFVRESTRVMAYEPFTGSRERPTVGKYVNVHDHGFRVIKNQGPWPPSREHLNVFCLGGSTTFGYGVMDADSVPSHLQELLQGTASKPVRVYNFGRGAYYSSQERALLAQLVVSGSVPDVVIFTDGLNDFYSVDDRPVLTPVLEQLVDRQGAPAENPYLAVLKGLPLKTALGEARRKLGLAAGGPGQEDEARGPDDDPVTIGRVVDRYIANKRLIEAIAHAYGIRAIFVWQPVPMYKYDPHYLSYPIKPGHRHVRSGYEAMAVRAAGGALGKNFLWCADVQEDLKEHLYVDSCHYTPAMARRTAECIVDMARARRLLD